MRKSFLAPAMFAVLCLSTAGSAFDGTYKGDGLVVRLAADGTGTIQFQGQDFPAQSAGSGGAITGSFTANGSRFEFTARVEGDAMTFNSGGKSYTLKKAGGNPLARNEAPVPASGRDEPRPAGRGIKDYAASSAGKGIESLFVHRDGGKSAKAALGQTLRDLSGWLDDKPKPNGAFNDAKDLRATATFSGTLKKKPVKGIISVGIGDKGAAVSVTYGPVDVPAAELFRAARTMAGDVRWLDARLPDGSGTMKLPEGWRITSAVNGAVEASGPDGQAVVLGISMPVQTPEAEQAWLQSQAAIGMRPQPSGLAIAPLGPPTRVLPILMPQFSAMFERSGGPSIRLVKIVESSTIPFAGQEGEIFVWLSDFGPERSAVRMGNLTLAASMPIGDGKYQFYYSTVSAPEARFPQDLPVLLQVWGSWKISDKLIQQRMAKAMDDMRAGHQSWREATDYRNKVTAQTNADFGEVIRGYRTVEDTRTGERTEMDLGNVTKIVEKMNEGEGYDRYKEIPARDEVFLY